MILIFVCDFFANYFSISLSSSMHYLLTTITLSLSLFYNILAINYDADLKASLGERSRRRARSRSKSPFRGLRKERQMRALVDQGTSSLSLVIHLFDLPCAISDFFKAILKWHYSIFPWLFRQTICLARSSINFKSRLLYHYSIFFH